ncbi:hypothetical protein OAW27_00295 [bacterium]|jgi:hypothetical protein|nr:hypothetical protein [bacterium]|tara:strand:- start:972 stop:1286 length:315 start_codon:yes stop_codon:yes gene_type:complete
MDNPAELAGFIETVGVPVATAIGLGGALWWLIKYVLGSIVEKITEAQAQTEADIKDLKGIVVALIDKTTAAQSDLIRLDTMIRVRYGLAPDEKRIGRNPDDKVK